MFLFFFNRLEYFFYHKPQNYKISGKVETEQVQNFAGDESSCE